ncbi:hypothetical protein BD779DRAFT_1668441 [Infundibulicybe gibba]|nr:hypothetical protein BD779DRAFT_1668441 [Infundibulicybe gibba]
MIPSDSRSRNGSPLRPAFSGVASYRVDQPTVGEELHPVIHAGRVALVTGAASGIGRAAALEFARLGLKIAIADVNVAALESTGKQLATMVGAANVLVVPTDVAQLEQVVRLRDKVYEAWGEVRRVSSISVSSSTAAVPLYSRSPHSMPICSPFHVYIICPHPTLPHPSSPIHPPTRVVPTRAAHPEIVAVLMNNAGIGPKGTSWGGIENWRSVFDVNLFGCVSPPPLPLADPYARTGRIVNVQQTFVPSMLHQENQAVIINTGSKQGITNPPGNAAYNASKAAVKSLTEGLAHELRERPDSNVTAHLFIPGWTFTGMTGASGLAPAKPAGAWSAEETVLYMLDRVRSGDFYILVPDNDTKREVDQLRIMWGAADIAEGRPALSRWHKDYKALFEEYMRDGLAQLE